MTAGPQHPSWGDARREPWQGDGFGLVLRGSYPVIGIEEHAGPPPTDVTELLLGTPTTAPLEGQRLREVRDNDGRLFMAIDDHGELGLSVRAPGWGMHHISRDGRVVRSSPCELPAWRWQQLLVGQVLPLIAVLRGHEVLHASAVVRGGRAFALAGSSGAGKSTLAARLVLEGDGLLADDVLSVSLSNSGHPEAHRGSVTLSVRDNEGGLATQLVGSGIAATVGRDSKQHLLLRGAEQRLPLAAVYVLGQYGEGSGPIGAATETAFFDLMGSSYIRYLRTQERLSSQLAVLSAVAQHCPIVPLNVGGGLTSAQLATELDAHIDEIAKARSR